MNKLASPYLCTKEIITFVSHFKTSIMGKEILKDVKHPLETNLAKEVNALQDALELSSLKEELLKLILNLKNKDQLTKISDAVKSIIRINRTEDKPIGNGPGGEQGNG
jgi:hypothetical protein